MPSKEDTRFLFRVPSPSSNTSEKEKIDRLAQDMNTTLLGVRAAFRNLVGEEGLPPPYAANLNMDGHKIVNVLDPTAKQDASTKNYVDSQLEEIRQLLDQVRLVIHNDLPAGILGVVRLQRTLTATLNDFVEIGNFTITNDAHSLLISAVVSDSGFSVAKQFLIVTQRGINTDWQTALPLVNTGAGGANEFALDVKQVDADSKLYLRLRRAAGATVGTVHVSIISQGLTSDVFTPTEATGNAAVTEILKSTVLTQVGGQVYAFRTGADVEVIMRRPEIVADATVLATLRASGMSDTSASRTYSEIRTLVSSDVNAAEYGELALLLIRNGALTESIRLARDGNVGVGVTALGASAVKVVGIGNGTPPSTFPANMAQQGSQDNGSGVSCPTFWPEDGNPVQLFQGASLTAENTSAVDLTYGAEEAGLLSNLRIRIGELEARLIALGLLP